MHCCPNQNAWRSFRRGWRCGWAYFPLVHTKFGFPNSNLLVWQDDHGADDSVHDDPPDRPDFMMRWLIEA